ncbi:MAG: ATP-binding cassette, subfamily er 3 [Candidatus Sumerlaeota bacterium]|nr:ATP-binding cassette, subfamily er 3 [Candidatus Sumerlaeota bacterium]
MFDVTNVNLHFGSRHILRNACLKVDDGERAAIVGPNGAGKSTLLKIVAGVLSPESGTVSCAKSSLIGYLPQEVVINAPHSVEDEVRTVFQEVLDHEKEMRAIEHRMSEMKNHDTDEYYEIADRYDYLLHETMRRDIYSMDSNIGKVMAGLGFSSADLKRSCREFSGGWQMRIALGKILLSNPDILLLDEPTNHLDIESIEWLGNWLLGHEGSLLMVSHERSFMDKLVTKIVEVDNGKINVYRGNYTAAMQKREDRREIQRRAYENQQIELQQIQRFIDRFRYQASKAALVQSRIKQLEKMEIIEAPTADASTIHFRFPPAPRSGKEVIVGKGLAKRFGDKVVFENADLQIYRGEKVALVGVNGAGKTTLMRILAGKLEPSEGTVSLGSNVEMEYFAQYDHEDLHPSNTVLGEFLSRAPLSVSDRARGILGAFLFSGDDVEKKVTVLSGGEKTRLRLARMLCGKANLLLLDEPTNHLDIGSRLTLESALRQYEGAVALVSHDRYFLDNVVTRVVEISEGAVHSYPGNYESYLRLKELQAQGSAPVVSVPAPIEPEPAPTPRAELDREERKRIHNERNRLNKELARTKKNLETLEDKVAELDELCRSIENAMGEPANATNPEKLTRLTAQLEESRANLESAEAEWAELQVAVEEMEAEVAEYDKALS